MRTAKVCVLPYDKEWKSAFENIKQEIEGTIGDLILGIEHVGSTAVEGMSAKPCIDIMIIECRKGKKAFSRLIFQPMQKAQNCFLLLYHSGRNRQISFRNLLANQRFAVEILEFRLSIVVIDVIIEDYTVFDSVVTKLENIGYNHEGNLGIKDREAFKYTNKPHLMSHHLYVCPKHSEELHRHLTFRDFLRQNPDAAKKYSTTKETAAKLFPNDIDKYIAYKSPCIEELYATCGLK